MKLPKVIDLVPLIENLMAQTGLTHGHVMVQNHELRDWFLSIHGLPDAVTVMTVTRAFTKFFYKKRSFDKKRNTNSYFFCMSFDPTSLEKKRA